MSSIAPTKRRQFLSGLMKLLVFIGFVFLSIPFISSFTTDDIEEKQGASSHWVVTYPTRELVEGEIKALPWSGGLFWIYTRTKFDIKSLKNGKTLLSDEFSEKSDQPESMKNNFRSVSDKYFVFIPQENKRGCQVRLNEEKDNVVFTEPCFSAKYDAAGRKILKTGHKEQQNLAVPEHTVESGILKIGIWIPKI